MKRAIIATAIALATVSAFCAGTKKFGKMKDSDWVVTNAWQAMQHRVAPDSEWATNHFVSTEFTNAACHIAENVVATVRLVAGEALDMAGEADTHALMAQGAADTAKTLAQTAQDTANQAVIDAATAQATAETAQSTANTALNTAQSAYSEADEAKNMAADAQDSADDAQDAAEAAQQTADTAKSIAEQAEADAQGAQATADSATTSAEDAMNAAIEAKEMISADNTTFSNEVATVVGTVTPPLPQNMLVKDNSGDVKTRGGESPKSMTLQNGDEKLELGYAGAGGRSWRCVIPNVYGEPAEVSLEPWAQAYGEGPGIAVSAPGFGIYAAIFQFPLSSGGGILALQNWSSLSRSLIDANSNTNADCECIGTNICKLIQQPVSNLVVECRDIYHDDELDVTFKKVVSGGRVYMKVIAVDGENE